MTQVTRTPRIALGILQILPFVLVVVGAMVGISLDLHKSDPTNRLRYHAIPVAISQLYHERAHDYTAYRSLAHRFQGGGQLEDLIDFAIAHEVPEDDPTYFWTADDRGLSDFVYLSFKLFGPGMRSIFLFWFLLLALSVLAYLLAFSHDRLALSVLNLTCLAIVVCIPVYVRSQGFEFSELSIHISESRLFEFLAGVATIFFIYSAACETRLARGRWLVGMILQALLLAFLLHNRSSLAWLFVSLITYSAIVLIFRHRRFGRRALQGAQIAIPLVIVMAWVAVPTYHAVMFHPSYKGEIGPRTVWHNFLMGMYYSPTFARDFSLTGVSDAQAVDAVLTHMKNTSDARLDETWNTTHILNSLGSHNEFSWRTYEAVAKEMVFGKMSANPGATLRLFLLDKPAAIFNTVACGSMFLFCDDDTKAVQEPLARYAPLAVLPLSLVLILAYLFTKSPGPDHAVADDRSSELTSSTSRILFAGIVAFTLLGLGPSLLFYPAITQLGGPYLFGTIALYSVIFAAWSHVVRRLAS